MDNATNEQDQALRQVKAFNVHNEYFGIPGDIFLAILGLSICLGITLKSLAFAALVALFCGVPAYQIHRNDIHAFKVWVKAVRRPCSRWSAGVAAPRQLLILDQEEE